MPLKVYLRNGIYHYRGTVAGDRLRGSCRTANKAIAQRIASEKENREWKCHFDGPASVLTFPQALSLYRQAGKSERFLEALEDHWKDTPVRMINDGAVRQAAIMMLPRASGATRNRHVIVPTQAIVNHAAALGYCQKLSVKRFPVVRRERDHATWAWIEAFRAEASPWLGALACFMFLTGARISEALEVRWSDVDLNAARVLIKQTKVGAERRAHLPSPLVAAIANIPGERKADGRVFRYVSRSTAQVPWRNAIKRAGIKPLTYHACRHGFATAMLQAGVDPITTAKRGGWKTAQHLFQTYGHAMDDETVTDRILGTPATQSVHRKRNNV